MCGCPKQPVVQTRDGQRRWQADIMLARLHAHDRSQLDQIAAATWWAPAKRPRDMEGRGILLQAGLVLDRCASWHAVHSPAAPAAEGLVARLAASEAGYGPPLDLTPAGRIAARLAHNVLAVCRRDSWERDRHRREQRG